MMLLKPELSSGKVNKSNTKMKYIRGDANSNDETKEEATAVVMLALSETELCSSSVGKLSLSSYSE